MHWLLYHSFSRAFAGLRLFPYVAKTKPPLPPPSAAAPPPDRQYRMHYMMKQRHVLTNIDATEQFHMIHIAAHNSIILNIHNEITGFQFRRCFASFSSSGAYSIQSMQRTLIYNNNIRSVGIKSYAHCEYPICDICMAQAYDMHVMES